MRARTFADEEPVRVFAEVNVRRRLSPRWAKTVLILR
jgi:hypothetical protein